MPRSRRAAARQAQLGQRKKRPAKGPSGIPATVDRPLGDEAPEQTAPVAGRPAVAPSPSVAAPQRQYASRLAEPVPVVYGYVRSEVRRIAALAAGVIAILIVLSFVLS